MTKLINDLEKILDYNFKDKNLLHELYFKSFSSSVNNEKLEFLGDRVWISVWKN